MRVGRAEFRSCGAIVFKAQPCKILQRLKRKFCVSHAFSPGSNHPNKSARNFKRLAGRANQQWPGAWPRICDERKCMYTSELMNVLRRLSWLDKERRCLTAGTTAAALVEKQQVAAREQLPRPLLSFHDRFSSRGKPSVVPLAGSSCSACHLKLPSGELDVLKVPGRYSMCPSCSVFVWSGEQPAIVEEPEAAKKSSRKKAYA